MAFNKGTRMTSLILFWVDYVGEYLTYKRMKTTDLPVLFSISSTGGPDKLGGSSSKLNQPSQPLHKCHKPTKPLNP